MLMIGVSGTELTTEEAGWLTHPNVSGVILFTRNFASRTQVTDLVADIRAKAGKPMIVSVDQEGGVVQRFRDGFSALPPLANFGEVYARSPEEAARMATEHAWLMANEMRACGLDLSFAPVVDLGRGNRAIGNRAFDPSPEVVAALTKAYVLGMHQAGMAATLKHFPGHGSVLEDTHFDMANDERPFTTIEEEDLLPFRAGMAAGAEAVMMAHVCYPNVCEHPAGYSKHWIGQVLKQDMAFSGAVISDDIGMKAAFSAGGVAPRIKAHVDAGCDAVLVCDPALVPEALATVDDMGLSDNRDTPALVALRGRGNAPDWSAMQADARYQQACALLLPDVDATNDTDTRLA